MKKRITKYQYVDIVIEDHDHCCTFPNKCESLMVWSGNNAYCTEFTILSGAFIKLNMDGKKPLRCIQCKDAEARYDNGL